MRRRAGWALACAVALAGCAPAVGPPSAPAPPAAYRVTGPDGATLPAAGLAAALDPVEVVFLGERHDDAGAHRFQRELLEALAARGREVVLGLEMFERDVQPLLDGYLAGRLSEDEFLAGARPWPNYAADYRPLVELARRRGWRVVATNVPRPLAARVSRAGLAALDSLPDPDRAHAAARLDCPLDDAYHRRFAGQMAAHPGGADPSARAAASAAVDRFYLAQCLKDETMAESIVRALEAAPGALVAHVNGAFHTDFGLGIVPRVRARRPGARVVTVSAVPAAEAAAPELADYRVVTGDR